MVLGIPGAADDVRFASNGARVTNREDLVQVLEAALAVDTADAWTTRLAFVGVPAGRVGSIADAFDLAERLGLEPTVSVGSDAPPTDPQPHHVEQDATDPVCGSAATGRAQPRRPPMADRGDRPMSPPTALHTGRVRCPQAPQMEPYEGSRSKGAARTC